MTYRGLLTFTDKHGDPAGEILLEELSRMPADWVEQAEARGLTWELGETPLCDSCLLQSLADEEFDGEMDACEKCKPYFRLSEEEKAMFCPVCRNPLPAKHIVLDDQPGQTIKRWCSDTCYLKSIVNRMIRKGVVTLSRHGRNRPPGHGCIGHILKRRLDRIEES